MLSALVVRRLGQCAMVGSLALVAQAGGVRNADRPQLGVYPTIQAAIDAASDGETLIVAPGAYASFTIDDRRLAVIAGPGGVVAVSGTVVVRNLNAARWVVLEGLSITGTATPAPQLGGPALELRDNLGSVHVEDCVLAGAPGTKANSSSQLFHGHGGHGAALSNCARVAFHRTTAAGGRGGWTGQNGNYESYGGRGGHGVEASGCALALYEGVLAGGEGGGAGIEGGHGGDGYRGVTGFAFASNVSLSGGRGGEAWDFLPWSAGDGGAGVDVGSAGRMHLVTCALQGGAAGQCWGCWKPAQPGPLVRGTGTVTIVAATTRTATATALWGDATNALVNVSGAPGDLVYVQCSSAPQFKFDPAANGVLLVGALVGPRRREFAILGPSGQATIAVALDDFSGPDAEQFEFAQAIAIDSAGRRWLSSPLHFASLDRLSPAADCDASGLNDLFEVTVGGGADLDLNLTPDACDPDCNQNGVPDGFDVQSGASADCDLNNQPDECQLVGGSPDCNQNGVQDLCDIGAGTSLDLNSNSVPDECEPSHVWHVDAAAAPGGDGSLNAPFQALAPAIQVSIDGDTILVHDGVYVGPLNRALALGGRSVRIESVNGSATCVLDAQGQSRHFSFTFADGDDVLLEGLTLRNGATSATQAGGSVSIAGASPTFRNCRFESCTSTLGGAIAATNSAARFEACVFSGNAAAPHTSWSSLGGAAYIEAGDVAFENCRFESNSAYQGGALYVRLTVPVPSFPQQTASSVLTHGVFAENSAYDRGGALFASGMAFTSFFLDNVLFAGNSAGVEGGAVHCAAFQFGSKPITYVTSSTFVENQAGAGGAWFARGAQDTRIYNSILWSNQASSGAQIALNGETGNLPTVKLEYCDVQGGAAQVWAPAGVLNWASGNVNVDPLFVDPFGPDLLAATVGDNDYRLSAGSACCDAGRNALLQLDLNDIDGDGNTSESVQRDLDLGLRRVDNPGVADSGLGNAPLVDLGCFEWRP